MKLIKRTAGFIGGSIRSAVTRINILTGGVSVRTEDIPIKPTVVDSLSLRDVELWIQRHVTVPDEPVKFAVARERHGQLWKVSFVVLTQRNRRSVDDDGRLRAEAQLARSIGSELDEFFGTHNTVLLSQ